MKYIKYILLTLLFATSLFAQPVKSVFSAKQYQVMKDSVGNWISDSLGSTNSDVITLPVTTGSSYGLMKFGADRFLHIYSDPLSDGRNTFVGINSGNFTMSINDSTPNISSDNTAFGYGTSSSIAGAYFTTAIGTYALNSNTTGAANTSVGTFSMQHNTSGEHNTAMGWNALHPNITGSTNVSIGANSMHSNISGSVNVAVGESTLGANTTGSYNTAIGKSSFSGLTTGYGNVGLGSNAGYGQGYTKQQSTIDSLMIFIGYQASRDSSVLQSTKLYNSIGIGADTRITKSNQIVLGNSNTTETNLNGVINLGSNRFIHSYTNSGVVGDNTFLGKDAGNLNLTVDAVFNASLGAYSLYGLSSGGYNTAIGKSSMQLNSSGNVNTAIGYNSLYNNLTGNSNSAIGSRSLYTNASGSFNTAVGDYTLFKATNSYNTSVGYLSLSDLTTGYGNIALGFSAGFGQGYTKQKSTIDSLMILIGYEASRDSSILQSTKLYNSTGIGAEVRITKSNQVILGNGDITETVLRGTINATGMPADSTGLNTGDLYFDSNGFVKRKF